MLMARNGLNIAFKNWSCEIPWSLRIQWEDITRKQANMSLIVTFMFREGNEFTDSLARFDVVHCERRWTSHSNFGSHFISDDLSSRTRYCFTSWWLETRRQTHAFEWGMECPNFVNSFIALVYVSRLKFWFSLHYFEDSCIFHFFYIYELNSFW